MFIAFVNAKKIRLNHVIGFVPSRSALGCVERTKLILDIQSFYKSMVCL